MAKQVTAQAKYLRGSARKTRAVAYTVRGMNAMQALSSLKYMNRRAAGKVYKVLNSAVANAVHNENMDPAKLIISDIRVNDAPIIKRFRAESKGRARSIMKRNSHLIVTVAEEGSTTKAETKAVKAEATETVSDETPKAKKPAAKKPISKSKKETK